MGRIIGTCIGIALFVCFAKYIVALALALLILFIIGLIAMLFF